MAKKSRRSNRRNINRGVDKPVADPLTSNRPAGFNPDYHIVIRDINRVGILAGSFILILVILSFFLH
jgi:hypothetical protein